jgi:hypothetical protein
VAGRKLKVFQAHMGFYDTVVAAPSQPAALRAWGVRQNLFASGQARPCDEPDAIRAALAHPETPLKRAVGSKAAFGLNASLPKVPDAPRRKPSTKAAAKPGSPELTKSPADRSSLDAAEAALKALDAARKQEEAALRREQDALAAKAAAAQAAYVSGRKDATAAILRARGDYRKAGGRD